MINIAIDGPAGSGKSTAAKNLAEALGIEYIDTGAMYRAVAYKVMQRNVPVEDDSLRALLHETEIDFQNGKIYLDGEDISDRIRTPQVSGMASRVAGLPSCRERLIELQRQMASQKDVVMDGRDIGSFVLPDASHKFFVTATLDTRAKRRWKELQAKGEPDTLEMVRQDLEKRDHNDMTRKLNPLVLAPDAQKIDTDDLTIEQVTETLCALVTGNPNYDHSKQPRIN